MTTLCSFPCRLQWWSIDRMRLSKPPFWMSSPSGGTSAGWVDSNPSVPGTDKIKKTKKIDQDTLSCRTHWDRFAVKRGIILKGFDVLISSTENRSFKQTNFPFFCASSWKKLMNQKEIDWQQKFQKQSYWEANEPSAFRDKHNIWALRHEDFLCPFVLLLRHARTTPPGFWNGLDWRALVEDSSPQLAKLKKKHFFSSANKKHFQKI